jgi:hypothetical protein
MLSTVVLAVYETAFGAVTSLGHLIAALLRSEAARRAANDRVIRMRRRAWRDRYAEPTA